MPIGTSCIYLLSKEINGGSIFIFEDFPLDLYHDICYPQYIEYLKNTPIGIETNVFKTKRQG